MGLKEPNAELAGRIHRVLPQTQCRRCGQPDCAAYAQAVARGEAPINQCPPGGRSGIIRIAQAMGRPELARGLDIDPACGREGPMALAVIDENWCIGCTLCIKACPTDAIVGGRKRMHTVQAQYCTGCELCVLACPVDCIAMEPACTADDGGSGGWQGWSQQQADQALRRYARRQSRVQAGGNASAAKLPAARGLEEIGVASAAEATGNEAAEAAPATAEQARKRAMIEAALARARRARQART